MFSIIDLDLDSCKGVAGVDDSAPRRFQARPVLMPKPGQPTGSFLPALRLE